MQNQHQQSNFSKDDYLEEGEPILNSQILELFDDQVAMDDKTNKVSKENQKKAFNVLKRLQISNIKQEPKGQEQPNLDSDIDIDQGANNNQSFAQKLNDQIQYPAIKQNSEKQKDKANDKNHQVLKKIKNIKKSQIPIQISTDTIKLGEKQFKNDQINKISPLQISEDLSHRKKTAEDYQSDQQIQKILSNHKNKHIIEGNIPIIELQTEQKIEGDTKICEKMVKMAKNGNKKYKYRQKGYKFEPRITKIGQIIKQYSPISGVSLYSNKKQEDRENSINTNIFSIQFSQTASASSTVNIIGEIIFLWSRTKVQEKWGKGEMTLLEVCDGTGSILVYVPNKYLANKKKAPNQKHQTDGFSDVNELDFEIGKTIHLYNCQIRQKYPQKVCLLVAYLTKVIITQTKKPLFTALKFALTISQVLESPVGWTCNIVCQILSKSPVQYIKTRKANLTLCHLSIYDPISMQKIVIKLWQEKTQIIFYTHGTTYVLRGIQIKEWNGKKQFHATKQFSYREVQVRQMGGVDTSVIKQKSMQELKQFLQSKDKQNHPLQMPNASNIQQAIIKLEKIKTKYCKLKSKEDGKIKKKQKQVKIIEQKPEFPKPSCQKSQKPPKLVRWFKQDENNDQKTVFAAYSFGRQNNQIKKSVRSQNCRRPTFKQNKQHNANASKQNDKNKQDNETGEPQVGFACWSISIIKILRIQIESNYLSSYTRCQICKMRILSQIQDQEQQRDKNFEQHLVPYVHEPKPQKVFSFKCIFFNGQNSYQGQLCENALYKLIEDQDSNYNPAEEAKQFRQTLKEKQEQQKSQFYNLYWNTKKQGTNQSNSHSCQQSNLNKNKSVINFSKTEGKKQKMKKLLNSFQQGSLRYKKFVINQLLESAMRAVVITTCDKIGPLKNEDNTNKKLESGIWITGHYIVDILPFCQQGQSIAVPNNKQHNSIKQQKYIKNFLKKGQESKSGGEDQSDEIANKLSKQQQLQQTRISRFN